MPVMDENGAPTGRSVPVGYTPAKSTAQRSDCAMLQKIYRVMKFIIAVNIK